MRRRRPEGMPHVRRRGSSPFDLLRQAAAPPGRHAQCQAPGHRPFLSRIYDPGQLEEVPDDQKGAPSAGRGALLSFYRIFIFLPEKAIFPTGTSPPFFLSVSVACPITFPNRERLFPLTAFATPLRPDLFFAGPVRSDCLSGPAPDDRSRAEKGRIEGGFYLVPNRRSPASPRPGTM